jgi:hypothetical protein
MNITTAWRIQIPLTIKAVLYVGPFLAEDSDSVGEVGEVARGK